MAKLARKTRSGIAGHVIRKVVGDSTFDKAHFVGTSLIKADQAPAPPLPTIPLPDDEAIKRARRRSLAAQAGRTGRASTILSDDTTDRLGP